MENQSKFKILMKRRRRDKKLKATMLSKKQSKQSKSMKARRFVKRPQQQRNFMTDKQSMSVFLPKRKQLRKGLAQKIAKITMK